MTAINGFKSDIKDFSGAQFQGRLGQAGDQISDMEDALASEKTKVLALEKQACELTSKINCLENRNHRSNLEDWWISRRKLKKGNAAAFLEKWLPDILGPETFPAPLIIEAAHRLPQSTTPQVMILKFLNFQDKIWVMQAARKKGKILLESHHAMFFHDISTKLHKRFNDVKQRLCHMVIVILVVGLVVTVSS